MPIKPSSDAAPKQSARRRTKKQLIEAAEIPADGTIFKMKLPEGEAEVPWPEAARRFIEAGGKGKGVDFVDTADRYRAWKWAESLSAPPAQQAADSDQHEEIKKARLHEDGSVWDYSREMNHEGTDLVIFTVRGGDGQEFSVPANAWEQMPVYVDPDAKPVEDQPAVLGDLPSDAQVGDEVRVGSDTFRVGHGGTLTSSPVSVDGKVLKPHRRWQRELGAGPGGQWQATIVGPEYEEQLAGAGQATDTVTPSVASQLEAQVAESVEKTGEVKPGEARSFTASDLDHVGLNVWRVGSGLLEKIGLPDYSALQVGPITASRQVVVTGDERLQITRENGSVITAPREVVEGILEAGHAVEIAARIIRADALSFIAAAKPGSVDMATGGGANMK